MRTVADRSPALLWAPAPAALLLGRRRTARVLVALAAVPSLLALFPFTGLPSDELRLAEAVFAWLTVAAVCCGHHADSPAPRMSPAPVGQALLATCVLMAASIVLWPVPVDSEWGLGAAFTVAAVAWPAVSRFTAGPERRRRPEAAFALAAVGLPILGLRLLMVSLLLRCSSRVGAPPATRDPRTCGPIRASPKFRASPK